MIKKIISLSICISLILSSVSFQYANENQSKDEESKNLIIESSISYAIDENDIMLDDSELIIATSSDAEFEDEGENPNGNSSSGDLGEEEEGISNTMTQSTSEVLVDSNEKDENSDDDNDLVSTSSEISVDKDYQNAKDTLDEDETPSNSDGVSAVVATSSDFDKEDDNLFDTDILVSTATDSIIVIEASASQVLLSTESELMGTDISEYLHGYTGKGIIQKKKNFKIKNSDDANFGTGDLPAFYDARTEVNPSNTSMSIISPVRFQTYGDCWAHATIALIEASIRKKGLVTTEAESNLSEAALIYNTSHLENITNGSVNMDKPGVEGNDYVTRANYVNGGDPIEALVMASSYMGFVTENEDTKYDKMDDIISNGLDGKYAFNSNSFVVANAETIASFGSESDRNKMKQAIKDYGAIQLPLNCDPTVNNSHEHDGEWYYYSDDGAGINHTLVAVGWNDNIPKEYFVNTEGHSPANNGGWLCKNSWGTNADFHNAGYFWLSYFDDALGSLYITADAIKADTYKYNYHYDTTTYYDYMNPASVYGGSMANIFKVTNDVDQSLDAISVAMAVYTGYRFDIEIYTKATAMTNPTDGTLKHTQSFDSEGKTGIFTIPLTTSVSLPKGTYYSIVLKCQSGGSLSVYLDETHTTGSIKYYNAAELGQSFTRSSSTAAWTDINEGQLETINDKTYGKNLRIKGLANPVGTPDPSDDPEPTPTPTPTPEPTPTPTPIPSKTVTTISVSSMPKMIEYITGDIFDPNGLVLTLKYSDNTTENIAYSNANRNDFRFNGQINLPLDTGSDQFEITITYASKTCKINVKVSASSTPPSDGGGSSSSSSSSSSSYVNGPLAQNRNSLVPSNNTINQSFISVPVNFNTQGSTWNRGANGTWQLTFKNDLGQQVQAKNMWININTQTIVNGQQALVDNYYYFDNTGNMLTGWLTDADNKKRFLETANNDDMGKMIRGWKQIGGSYYYFDLNGFLLTSGITPDGYSVDVNGVWVNR